MLQLLSLQGESPRYQADRRGLRKDDDKKNSNPNHQAIAGHFTDQHRPISQLIRIMTVQHVYRPSVTTSSFLAVLHKTSLGAATKLNK
jgi:hypothetical protein